MSTAVPIPQWVKEARQYARLTQEALGDQLGVTKGNVSGWENGRHQPSFAQLIKISRLTRYSLMYAEGMDDTELPTSVEEEAAPYRTSSVSLEPILAWEHQQDLPEGEFVMIPRLDVKLSAGNGHEHVEVQLETKQPQAFRADWIREQRFKPNRLAALSASGDSMEPSIYDGDSLLVDTSQTEVVDGRVFALWYDGGERVKRLFRLPGGGLRIQSDNPRYAPIELKADTMVHVTILGQVVHRSGRGGL